MESCDSRTGYCTSGACEAGFWGYDATTQLATCDLNCPANTSTVCEGAGSGACDVMTSRCQGGCNVGYWGYDYITDKSLCDKVCNASQHCLDAPACDGSSGLCTNGNSASCQNGWFGYHSEFNAYTCDQQCSTSMQCSNSPACDGRTGLCSGGTGGSCAQGFWGWDPYLNSFTCNQKCDTASHHCVDNPNCNPVHGLCTGGTNGGCLAGWYGFDDQHNAFACDLQCPSANNCINSPECDGMTGLCTGGRNANCKPGFYGMELPLYWYHCRTPCPSTNQCSDSPSCDRYSGGCNGGGSATCKSGYYGWDPVLQRYHCSTPCASPNCADAPNCDRATGKCTGGNSGSCKAGFYGYDAGVQQYTCNQPCPSSSVQHCAGTPGVCDGVTGMCTTSGWDGCENGYYGYDQETGKLSCDQQCNSAYHCAHDNLCEGDTGLCCWGHGCASGYWGSIPSINLYTCSNGCSSNCGGGAGTCNEGDGTCDGCRPGYTGPLCTSPSGLNKICNALTSKLISSMLDKIFTPTERCEDLASDLFDRCIEYYGEACLEDPELIVLGLDAFAFCSVSTLAVGFACNTIGGDVLDKIADYAAGKICSYATGVPDTGLVVPTDADELGAFTLQRVSPALLSDVHSKVMRRHSRSVYELIEKHGRATSTVGGRTWRAPMVTAPSASPSYPVWPDAFTVMALIVTNGSSSTAIPTLIVQDFQNQTQAVASNVTAQGSLEGISVKFMNCSGDLGVGLVYGYVPQASECRFVSGVTCVVPEDYLSAYIASAFNTTSQLQFNGTNGTSNTWTVAVPDSGFTVVYVEEATTRYPVSLTGSLSSATRGVVTTSITFSNFVPYVTAEAGSLFQAPSNCTEVVGNSTALHTGHEAAAVGVRHRGQARHPM